MAADKRTVIVTGGTGALGRAVVAHLLSRGDRVVVPWIVPREKDEVQALWSVELEASAVVLVEADVAEQSGAEKVAKAAPQAAALIHIVGGFGGGSPVWESELELWDRMYRMNVRTAVAMARAVLPGMLARKDGAIVHISSRAALDRPAGIGAYSASKAAVMVLTETLQKEAGPHGVRVNAIVPTTIDTPQNRAAMPDADFSAWTSPDKIAEVIGWLIGPQGQAVRGGLIPV
jgi:NAD(P)-dependent dehydrogenase (short-subunit alcohol dehydrogenase family)